MRIAVVIPALNEAASIAATLAAAASAGVDLIVADGGSGDATREIAAAAGAKVIVATGGRAAQQNVGAAASDAPLLLFLHADTRLPGGWADRVRATLADPSVALGAFQLAIDGATPAERLIAWGANLRSRSFGLPYGDQALFLRRTTFDALGGFRPLPIMDDWELARRAGRLGRIQIARESVTTSARRWRKLGALRTTIVNQLMLAGFHAGVDPARLARFYRSFGR